MFDGLADRVPTDNLDIIVNCPGAQAHQKGGQEAKDDTLRRFHPDIMAHGTTGVLAKMRQKVIDLMAQWGGEGVEQEYNLGVSSCQFKEKVKHTL